MKTGIIGHTHVQLYVSGIHEWIFVCHYYNHCSSGSLSTLWILEEQEHVRAHKYAQERMFVAENAAT